jgi:WD40 repeat protein
VEVYDLTTGRATVSLGPGSPFSLAFDPSGQYLAVGHQAGRAQVFDFVELVEGKAAAEAAVFDVVTDDDDLWGVALSGNGVLATSSAESLRLWDVNTLELIGSPRVDTLLPGFPAFSPDDAYLLYADGRSLRRYIFEPQALIDLAATRVTRALTVAECNRYLISDCREPG